jgi:hypothetical protein
MFQNNESISVFSISPVWCHSERGKSVRLSLKWSCSDTLTESPVRYLSCTIHLSYCRFTWTSISNKDQINTSDDVDHIFTWLTFAVPIQSVLRWVLIGVWSQKSALRIRTYDITESHIETTRVSHEMKTSEKQFVYWLYRTVINI